MNTKQIQEQTNFKNNYTKLINSILFRLNELMFQPCQYIFAPPSLSFPVRSLICYINLSLYKYQMIEMEQDDYHEPIQNLDMSIDQPQTHNEILLSLYQDSCSNLLNNYQNILNDKETLDKLKKDFGVLDSRVKENFLKEFCQKISQIAKQIIDGNQNFKKLKESGLLQFLLLTELKNSDITTEIYQILHSLLSKQTDGKNFMYLFKILFKIAKPIEKRQTLIQELASLNKNVKQKIKNDIYDISEKLISEDDDLVKSEQRYQLLLYISYYLCSNENPNYKMAEEDFKKLCQIVKQKPFANALDFIMKNQSRNKKLTKQIINSEFKVVDGTPKYIYPPQTLHKALETRDTYLRALLILPEKIIQQLRLQNFIEVQNKIFPKINLQTLKKIAEQSKLETGEYALETIEQLIDVVKYFLKSSDKKIGSFTSQTQMQQENVQENCDKFLIYSWAIFAKYYYDHQRNSMSFDFLAEKLNAQALNQLLNRSLEYLDGKIPQNEAQYFGEQLIKIVIHLLYKTEYSVLANYTSETSKLLQKVLLKVKQFPYKWRNLKKINAMLDKWAETTPAVTPNITQIMNKFLNTFFDTKMQLKSKPFSQLELLNSSQYSKNLVQLISNKIKDNLKQFILKIQQNSQNESKREQQYKKLQGFLYKISCLYITRMKIPDNQGIADLLFELYQMNSFYVSKFRTWILNYSNKSKDHFALKDVNNYSQQILGRLEKFRNIIINLDVQVLLKSGKKAKECQGYLFIKQFSNKMQLMINNLELKRRQDIYGADLYFNILHIVEQLTKTVTQLQDKLLQKISLNPEQYKKTIQTLEISQSSSIYKEIATLTTDLTKTLTFYLFNLNTLLDPKDQLHLLTQTSILIRKLSDKNNINQCNIKFINDLFGHNQTGLSHLEFGQILQSVLQRNGVENRDQFYFNKQQYTSLMIVSVLYGKTRAEYPKIVKNLLQNIKSEDRSLSRNYHSDLLFSAKTYSKDKELAPIRLQTQCQKLISNIVFPSVNIFGCSYFHNKVQEKGRQQEALAILLDQFSIFYNGLLSPKQITSLSRQLVSFLSVCKDKQRKIVSKQVLRAHRNPRRHFGEQNSRMQLIHSLGGMGFQSDIVQYAIQQINDLEPQAVMNWLQQNHDRIDSIRTAIAMQRSKNESVMTLRQKQSEGEQTQFSIPLINYAQFIKTTNKSTKTLIKKLYPEFFSDFGTKIKDLIFVCLDSFQEQEFKNKQLTQFSQAMYKQIEGLKNNFSLNKLVIAVSSLETIIVKKPGIINKMHENSIPLTLLSFLEKVDQKAGERILSVINSTLPNPTQNCSPILKEYINYIGNVLLFCPLKSQYLGQLLLKMSKTKDPQITKKILQIICKNIQTKSFQKEKLFPILNLILDNQKSLITANIELDIKNYILESTQLQNNKDRFIKIDNKKFGFAFVKYEDNPYFAEVVNKILVKKNGKLSMEILQHDLYLSQILCSSYFDLQLSDNVKIILQSIISQIVKQQDKTARLDYIRQLHKILQFYRILIPFCLKVPIQNQNLTFFEWLVQKQFPRLRGNILPFITFLFTQNGLSLSSQQSYSDYLTSLIIIKYIKQQRINQDKWSKLLILYLLHIKCFYKKNGICISEQNQITLKQYLQASLNPAQPINYVLISQSVYLILKQQLIEKLSNKYRIESIDEPAIDKQFLNMELFYMRKRLSSIMENQQEQTNQSRFFNRFSIQRLIQRSGGDDLGEDGQNIQSFLRRMLLMRDRDSYEVVRSPNINSMFVPIQPPPQRQPQRAQQAPQQANQQQAVQNQGQKAQQIVQKEKKQQQKRPVQEMIPQQVKQTKPQKYLSSTVEKFNDFLPKYNVCQMKMPALNEKQQKAPLVKLTQKQLKDATYHIQLKEPKTSLDVKVNKTVVFKQRISQIAESVVDPEEKWILPSEDKRRQFAGLSANNRGLRARDEQLRSQGLGGFRRNMINRLMGLERQRQNQAPTQTFNVNRLLTQMQEYQQPKPQPKPQPKKQQQQKKQQKILVQQKQKKQEQKIVQKKQEIEMKQEKQEIKQPKQPKQPKQQKMQQQKPQIQQKMEQVKPITEQKAQQKVIVPSEEKKQQKMEQEIPKQEKPKQEKPQVEQQMIPQIPHQQQPVQPVIQQMVQEVPEPHRQILEMYGVPQTFLRDLGINAAQFDLMPEDIQMEQMHFYIQNQTLLRSQRQQQLNQQNQNQNNNQNPNQNNPNNQNQNPPQNIMTELQMENAAFIQSLDPQLRAQTLMEAAPDFLMTLPPAMRAQAANYRERQIAQMLRDEQMQLEQERVNQVRQPKVLIYPQLTEQNFPQISHEIAQKITKGVLIKMPKFRIQSFKILIQNKKTQKEAINTLISFIKNIENITMLECKYNKQKKQWEYESNNFTGVNRKVFIQDLLTFLDEQINNCIYKDEKFLSDKEKYHRKNYSGIQLPINEQLYGDADGYYPIYELLQIAMDNHQVTLLNKLIKKVTKLPRKLRRRVVKGIRQDKFSVQFYSNLEGLSNNQKLKEAFMKQFPEQKPIKVQTLSKLLKYEFCKVPYLKKLHIQTLKKYKGARTEQVYDFLNQIFSSYTADDIKQIEQILLQHKQTHFSIIKYLYESGRSLDTEPIKLILKFPHLLDFQTKRYIFQRNPKLHRSRQRCIIEVDRTNLFQQSYNQIMNKTVKQLQGSIKVVFMGEQAEDAGGPKKQWFLSLSKSIFDPHYALFQPSSSGNTYQPNPKSYVNTEHLSYFKFIGRFFAKALCEDQLIDAFFTRSFYKVILGHELQLKDLEEQDYSFYKSMIWLKQNPFKGDEQYTYSYIYDYFGKIITKELVPGGENIKVTQQNKADYIHKYSMAMMRDAIGAQIQKFLQGFYQILPRQEISFFEPAQLELLMSGLPTIDLNDLQLNTDYQGYAPTQPIIKWYWQILAEYSNQQLAKLVQFITGTSKIPLEGFSKLKGMHGPQKISIHKDCHIDQLPKSHTCFNQLDLPNYPTKQMLKEKLRVAITWGSEGFGFM